MASPDSSLAAGAVIPESPSVIVVHEANLPALLQGADSEDIWNADETGYFFRALPRRTLAVQCRKGMKIGRKN